jgi:hypothetical protein
VKVVVTDYPDEELIENLRYNIEHWSESHKSTNIVAQVRQSEAWSTSPHEY